MARRDVFVLFGVAGLIAWVQWALRTTASSGAGPSLTIHDRTRALPALRFVDGMGSSTSLAAYRGRVVLLNVWATWCAPCVKEMPALDRLQAMLGGPDFEVVALSIDEAGDRAVRAFFRQIGIKRLRPYVDAFQEASLTLATSGIPLTLLIDRDGREVGRRLGPAEWDRPHLVELLRDQLRRMSTAPAPAIGSR